MYSVKFSKRPNVVENINQDVNAKAEIITSNGDRNGSFA